VQQPDRVTITRRIAAPAHRIFEILTDPQRHVDIDSSGMLLAAPNATPLRAVGDTFEIDMDREPLGDLPLGKYKVVNTVTSWIQDVEVAWTVVAPGKRSAGHVWGYHLEPVNDNETNVTNYYDWSAVSQEWRERFHWPVVPPAMFEQTLVNLERIATEEN
jgi:hypothetical protein